ncbi:dynamin family protein [Limosilactobacillus mucosae]
MGIRDRARELDESGALKKKLNPYLNDPEQALNLIYQVLPSKKDKFRKFDIGQLDQMLEEQLPECVRLLPIGHSMTLNEKMSDLSQRLMEGEILANKNLIGVGGQFSAGKSKFLNSLIKVSDTMRLPENQKSTTSIPTYVVGSDHDEISIVTQYNKIVVDGQAMQALTHEFSEKFEISLRRFIKYIVIKSNSFPDKWKQSLVFLDTPGYSRSEITSEQTDKELSLRELRNVNSLIWLINSVTGAVTTNDIEFLQQLPENIPVLVVFTRADSKTTEELQQIIKEAEKTLNQNGIHPRAITAYDSVRGVEYASQHHIVDYFKAIEKKTLNSTGFKALNELNLLFDKIDNEFKQVALGLDEDRVNLKNIIRNSNNIMGLESVVDLYVDNVRQLDALKYDQRRYDNLKKKILKKIELLS